MKEKKPKEDKGKKRKRSDAGRERELLEIETDLTTKKRKKPVSKGMLSSSYYCFCLFCWLLHLLTNATPHNFFLFTNVVFLCF